MRIILITILLFAATSLFAQKTRHISVEILGAQNTVGINYDSRFKGTYGLGYRVGIGYGYGRNSGWFDESIKGVGVPLELNYLLGKKNSKLELGFGASLGIYRVKGEVAYYKNGIQIGIIPMKRFLNLITIRHRAVSSVISSSETSATAMSAPADSCFV